MRSARGWSMLSVIVVMIVMAAMFAGCTTTPAWNQDQANSIAQTVGAGCVLALNTKGDTLKPQEKQAALAAIAALSTMGNADLSKGLGPQVDTVIETKIKDPAQQAAAKAMAASFVAMISPQVADAVNKAGASGASQVFLAFCKGLGSVPLK